MQVGYSGAEFDVFYFEDCLGGGGAAKEFEVQVNWMWFRAVLVCCLHVGARYYKERACDIAAVGDVSYAPFCSEIGGVGV